VKDRLLRGAARALLVPPLARALGARRRRGPAAALDPQVAAILQLQRVLRLPPLDSMEPARARAFAEAGLSPLDVAPAPMAQLIDTTAAGIPVRLYVPPGAGPNWLVYFHGGGGVIGSIRASEPVTRLLAAQTSCTVASVEYRLGPEHHHPAAIDDACAAFDALAARAARTSPAGDAVRIAVAGDSFGGYLSAHVDRRATRRPDLQVLIYPLTDMLLGSPSIEAHAHGYLLTGSMIRWFRSNYLGPHAGDTEYLRSISPLHWPDAVLRRAGPAIVVTAGFDPLVDEGDAYAARLQQAGVPVVLQRHPSLIHGFLSLAGAVAQAREAIDELTAAIAAGMIVRRDLGADRAG